MKICFEDLFFLFVIDSNFLDGNIIFIWYIIYENKFFIFVKGFKDYYLGK